MNKNFNELGLGRNLELTAKQLVEGFITGIHKSPNHGFSVEFAEHRLYNQGESIRHMDWRVFARTERLYLKQYEEETNLRCVIVMDCSSSMRYPQNEHSKLWFGIQLSAALVHMLHRQRDAVGLCLFSEHIDLFTPIKSKRTHISQLFQTLARELDDTSHVPTRTSIASVLHQVAEKIHRRSMVIILSDLFDQGADNQGLFEGLQHLKHNHHETLLFHIADQETELDFRFEDRPHEFIDVETGRTIKTHPAMIRASVQQRSAQFIEDLKLKCHQLKIDFTPVDARGDYAQALQAYLIKRAKMG